jgi:diaminohydroxyphosphoribosylaminopyrimidine deaminase/5-amino-6-(5-phosphoribosylamino)uracil reductase
MTRDEKFMRRAIEVARLADSDVYPNPYVGCVITHDDKIIAEGFHRKYGEAHAEVNAVNEVSDKAVLKDCTIYVTLEPCAHHGKTPPCANLLIEHQFKRVVVGSIDPFALVNGEGIKRLRDAGIEVEVGVLKDECDALNVRFFTFHRKRRPFISLKWAESEDGFIAPSEQNFGERLRITGNAAHKKVHEQRSKEHAILIGRKTAVKDNPSLSVRYVKGKNPIRLVIDPKLRLPQHLKIFNDGAPTYVLNHEKDENFGPVRRIHIEHITPNSICKKLFEMGIISVYIEGGATTIQHFIDADLWDTANIFTGKIKLEHGIAAPRFKGDSQFDIVAREILDQDVLTIYRNNRI